MQFDRAKLKAVILETCHRCPPDRLGAVKLHKVLYFLDMINYAQAGVAITGATYRKRPFGPTCDQLLPMLREMERAGEIEINKVAYHGLLKQEYVAKTIADDQALNSVETALLNDVVEFVCQQHTAKTISDYSHQMPWEMADFGEIIPYNTALLLYPTHPSPEAFDMVNEEVSEIEAARQSQNSMDFPLLSSFRGRIQAKVSRL